MYQDFPTSFPSRALDFFFIFCGVCFISCDFDSYLVFVFLDRPGTYHIQLFDIAGVDSRDASLCTA